MRLLMLKQPWLNLIVEKYKTSESRYWNRQCNYRGEILLASSKQSDSPGQVRAIMTPGQWANFLNIQENLKYDIYRPVSSAGCIITMIAFSPMKIEDEKTAFVKFHEELKIIHFINVRPVESFHVSGMLGLLKCPEKYLTQIKFE